MFNLANFDDIPSLYWYHQCEDVQIGNLLQTVGTYWLEMWKLDPDSGTFSISPDEQVRWKQFLGLIAISPGLLVCHHNCAMEAMECYQHCWQLSKSRFENINRIPFWQKADCLCLSCSKGRGGWGRTKEKTFSHSSVDFRDLAPFGIMFVCIWPMFTQHFIAFNYMSSNCVRKWDKMYNVNLQQRILELVHF